MSAFQWLVGEADGHSTEFAALHPNLQVAFEAARSELRSMTLDTVDVIGCSKAWDIAPYFFAALDSTGEKAQTLDFEPLSATLGEYVELYEVPSPAMFLVGSTTSAAVAIALVVFKSVNVSGYGDWNDADAYIEGIYDTRDLAEERFINIVRAYRTLRTVYNKVNNGKTVRSNRPSF